MEDLVEKHTKCTYLNIAKEQLSWPLKLSSSSICLAAYYNASGNIVILAEYIRVIFVTCL